MNPVKTHYSRNMYIRQSLRLRTSFTFSFVNILNILVLYKIFHSDPNQILPDQTMYPCSVFTYGRFNMGEVYTGTFYYLSFLKDYLPRLSIHGTINETQLHRTSLLYISENLVTSPITGQVDLSLDLPFQDLLLCVPSESISVQYMYTFIYPSYFYKQSVQVGSTFFICPSNCQLKLVKVITGEVLSVPSVYVSPTIPKMNGVLGRSMMTQIYKSISRRLGMCLEDYIL